jgi:hypothetical protein
MIRGISMKHTWRLIPVMISLNSPLVYAANLKTEIILSCPVQGLYLDGNKIKDTGKEQLEITITEKDLSTKDGEPQIYTILDAKIASSDKTFRVQVIAHTPDYIIVGYGNLLKEGIGAHIIVANYIIDLKTKKMRRTLSLFPNGKDWSFDGECEDGQN